MTEMDEGARRWLLKTAGENYWRVAAWMEFDDLVQDGALCYQRVIAKYEERKYTTRTGVVTNKSRRVRKRKHIMSLFMRTFHAHITDLAKQRTVNSVEVRAFDIVAEELIVDDVWDELVQGDANINGFEQLIAEAPGVLQIVLRALITDSSAPSALFAPYRVRKNGRETVNERLCRIAGLDPRTIDVAGMLKSYLHHQPLSV